MNQPSCDHGLVRPAPSGRDKDHSMRTRLNGSPQLHEHRPRSRGRAESANLDQIKAQRVFIHSDSEGEIRLILRRMEGGLYVERQHRPKRGIQSELCCVLQDVAILNQWCDEDALRFSHPALFLAFRRDARELLESAGPGKQTSCPIAEPGGAGRR